jgi:hypothetical protein
MPIAAIVILVDFRGHASNQLYPAARRRRARRPIRGNVVPLSAARDKQERPPAKAGPFRSHSEPRVFWRWRFDCGRLRAGWIRFAAVEPVDNVGANGPRSQLRLAGLVCPCRSAVRRSSLFRVRPDKADEGTLALEPMHGYGIAVRLEQMRGTCCCFQSERLLYGRDPVFLARNRESRRREAAGRIEGSAKCPAREAPLRQSVTPGHDAVAKSKPSGAR